LVTPDARHHFGSGTTKRDVGHSTTGSAAQEVLSSATKLASQSEVLRNEVDRFLASIRAA
jgi:hypothetical protein